MHSLLEEYLDAVRARLWALPRKTRDEELRELRQHLARLDTDYQAQGMAEEEAAWATLAHFGSPDILGGQMVRAWRRGLLLRWSIGPMAMATGFLLYLPMLLLHVLLPSQPALNHAVLIHTLPVLIAFAWYAFVGACIGRITAGKTFGATVGVALLGVSLVIVIQPFLTWPVSGRIPHLALPLINPIHAALLVHALLYAWALSAFLVGPAALLGRAWTLRRSGQRKEKPCRN